MLLFFFFLPLPHYVFTICLGYINHGVPGGAGSTNGIRNAECAYKLKMGWRKGSLMNTNGANCVGHELDEIWDGPQQPNTDVVQYTTIPTGENGFIVRGMGTALVGREH
ncbi:hypothetical protein GGR55DRAFT_343902 [Xylaria sp. FL0064]|nr:hypothetical protein GGR55DRAFT_343902 [Xylaria sp. FL0064]